ncbi:MAG: FAD-dependent oxidoreductase [Clostridia bacterium]|nr:FAD-dependent oxidoreductase [Clostridia bacterium]
MYDIIIVGAGPAGLTAALYARRAEKRVLLIERECFGGQITRSPRVENYPGYPVLTGAELGDKLFEHAIAQGAEIELDTVVGIEGEAGDITVLTEGGSFKGKTVIIATGSEHRTLGIEGEELYTGEGISYCAVCDGAFYKDKSVVIIGGGNSALQEAVLLSESCKDVTVVQNLGFLTGEASLQEILKKKDNVKVILSSVVTEIVGDGKTFRGIKIINTESGEESELITDGMFVAIGQKPQCEPFAGVVDLNDHGYVSAGEDCLPDSTIPGVFVAGDCRTKAVRQVTTATADGAVAALAACRFIDAL